MFYYHSSSVKKYNQHISIVQQAYDEAIQQITHLTGLTEQQSLALLQQQLQQKLSTTQVKKKNDRAIVKNTTLQDNEHQFIAQLFH